MFKCWKKLHEAPLGISWHFLSPEGFKVLEDLVRLYGCILHTAMEMTNQWINMGNSLLDSILIHGVRMLPLGRVKTRR